MYIHVRFDRNYSGSLRTRFFQRMEYLIASLIRYQAAIAARCDFRSIEQQRTIEARLSPAVPRHKRARCATDVNV
jgi:hypothetical protein